MRPKLFGFFFSEIEIEAIPPYWCYFCSDRISPSVFFQVMFWEGEARGPARLRKPDGSVEERQYSNGSKEGPATLRLPNGDTIEYSYRADEIEGESTYTWANGSTETSVYVKGVKVLGATEDCSTIYLTNIDWKKRGSILLPRK